MVTGEGADAPNQDLPVPVEADRAAGKRCADGTDSGGAWQVHSAGPHGLGQAVALQDGDPRAAVEVPQALAQRPAPGDHMGDLPTQDGAQGGEDDPVESRALGLQPARRSLGGVQGP